MNDPQTTVEIFGGWLRQIAASLGKDIELDENSGCSFDFEDGIEVSFAGSNATEAFHMSSFIGNLPDDENERYPVLQRCLHFNLEQAETLLCTLCLTPYREIFLTYSRTVEEYDVDRLVRSFALFHDACVRAQSFVLDQPDA